ncbi:unnamed protein product [Rotaria sp. Silwood2]|nr:unnamed protein product [Rotaria sp. Silwood2]CAF4196622.1 unnamed protein product [Rotaria sp. Silwood2]CAF4565502.1 unnamed protein product [Rotaria sp. Silwood2]
MRITNWKEALKNYNLAYEIKKKELYPNHRKIGRALNCIGNYYKVIEDYVQAMKFYEDALQCQNDPCAQAIIQLNICIIHPMNKNYDKHYFHATFELSKRILLNGVHIRIQSIKLLADLYNKQGKKQKAIDFCYEELSLYEKEPSENEISMANILMIIGELYEDSNDQKIQVLDKALSLLKKNMHIQYATTAKCCFMIAEYYHKQNISKKAFDHAMRALEIRRKIYPDNHSILIETQTLIDTIKSLK